MGVVSAGVHDAGLRGFIDNVIGFEDGQGVKIGSQRNRFFVGILSFNQGNNAIFGYSVGVRNAVFFEFGGYVFARFDFFVAQFGVHVQVATHRNYVRVVAFGEFFNRIFYHK